MVDQRNPEDNQAQVQSDATPDEPGRPDRVQGSGSDANGIPEFDEADGERRKELYRKGAKLVSRID